MADNVGITTGSDANIAADDISGVYYQRIKVGWGADGAWVTASADTGNVDTGTLRVTIADDDTNLAAITAAAEAIQTAVEGTLTVDLGANNDVTVTGSVTANAGTNLNTSALALESGGNLATAATLLGTIDTDAGNIAAGFATEGSALGSGVLLQGDDGTDRQNFQIDDTSKGLKVEVWGQGQAIGASVLGTQADALGNGTNGFVVTGLSYGFNGTTWDRLRGDAKHGLRAAPQSDTGAASQVADTNSDTTILAANADRIGASVYNSSSAILYLLCANDTASATNFTAPLNSGDYFEVPAGYTGVVKGIWASDPGDGSAHVTEWDNA